MSGSVNDEKRDKVIRPAASFLLVRDGENGVEVLTLKRSQSMRFLPGFLAFPGGTLDAEDWETHPSFTIGTVRAQQHSDDGTYAVGGIRECAEEVGWLCAVAQQGGTERAELLQVDEHTRLLHNELPLSDVLSAREAWIDLCAIRFVGRWVTPARMPARFDTRFFLYIMPSQDLAVRLQSSENEWVKWCRPADMLAGIENGLEKAVTPTIAMLKALSAQPSVYECFQHLSVSGPTPER